MKTLKYTGQFKKDLKRYQNKPKQIAELYSVLNLLTEKGKVPQKYKPHYLNEEYSGCLECHVENDFLLIWLDEENDVIKLIRVGSHSELFK
jgi:mRNA interferase YafQ